MKKLVVIIILLLLPSLAFASSFCAGWRDGYIAGYCYQKYSCMEPFVPMCPMPRVGGNSYENGYDRGFLAGLNARR